MTELLTVVAIFCLLCSFLMPALTRGIDRAKLTNCGNNLRNIGCSVEFYCADNRGCMPNIIPGMEKNSIPALRLPGNMVLALGRLVDEYSNTAGIFGCPGSPGYREEDVAKLWKTPGMVWSAYLYRGQNGNFANRLHVSGNIRKPYVMDFACLTNQGEQFAPHNYQAVNMLYPDCHVESRRNTREAFRYFTAQAALHGEMTPDCTKIWQNADL